MVIIMLTEWIASVHVKYRFFFNTIINRPFHWNHFCTSMSSVILHDDTISDIGLCGANFFPKTFLKLCEAITTHGTGNLNFRPRAYQEFFVGTATPFHHT